MFNMYDRVRIVSKDLIGTIVDERKSAGKTIYTVESDTKGKRSDGYGGVFPLFDCAENELEKCDRP